MDLKTKNPSDYMNLSLANKAREELVPMLQDMCRSVVGTARAPEATDGGGDQAKGNTLGR